MNKQRLPTADPPRERDIKTIVNAGLPRRHAAERRFRWYGLIAISLGLAFVVLDVRQHHRQGLSGVLADLYPGADHLRPGRDRPRGPAIRKSGQSADYAALVRAACARLFPQSRAGWNLRALYGWSAPTPPTNCNGGWAEPRPDRRQQDLAAGQRRRSTPWSRATSTAPSTNRSGRSRTTKSNGSTSCKPPARSRSSFNTDPVQQRRFPRTGTGRHSWRADGFVLHPAGHLPAVFPIGVATAVYLEEFAPKNRWTDLIEVNINNLAAVPSIVFGLLGLAVFINFFGLPRSAPLVGGLVLEPDDLAGDHHRRPRRADLGAAFHPRSGAGHGRVQIADGRPSRPAAGDARHVDRLDHRHGPRPGRIGAAADDRHGRLHRRRAQAASPIPPRCCRCRFTSGPICRNGPSWSGPRPRSWCCWPS
jgi:phosphate transport system permease protein